MEAITEKITPEQTVQLNRFMEDLVRKLNLSKDEAQQIIKSFNLVKPEVEKNLRKYSVVVQPFEFVKTFEIEVPADYNHATRLESFKKENKKKFYGYNDDITDQNFSKVSTILQPRKKMLVKVFGIKSGQVVSSQSCVDLLKSQNAIFTGAQGASLVWEQKREELPKGKFCASFDEKDNLWKDSAGRHRVPNVAAYGDGDFAFRLGNFVINWNDGDCILCFCDISTEVL